MSRMSGKRKPEPWTIGKDEPVDVDSDVATDPLEHASQIKMPASQRSARDFFLSVLLFQGGSVERGVYCILALYVFLS